METIFVLLVVRGEFDSRDKNLRQSKLPVPENLIRSRYIDKGRSEERKRNHRTRGDDSLFRSRVQTKRQGIVFVATKAR